MSKNLYTYEPNVHTRWASFENPKAARGAGGLANGGAKGRAYEPFAAGETKVLLDTAGSGVITRIWLTLCNRTAEALAAVRLRMFWDGAEMPAVDVPLGDFFCAPYGKLIAFENELFSSPEGRSFNCFIPMPFRTGARIELVNTLDTLIQHIFYDVDFELRPVGDDALYFHCVHNTSGNLPLCEDYAILPQTAGAGKIIGTCVGVISNPAYQNLWWGEGEVKVYLDGDTDVPTLCGTGAEDYIGTGWGLGQYVNRTQSSMVAGDDNVYTFCRMHTRDPIHFHDGVHMTIQAIGGGMKEDLLKVDQAVAPYKIVTGDKDGELTWLYETDFELTGDSPDGWYNFYRLDTFTSTAYFYLNRA